MIKKLLFVTSVLFISLTGFAIASIPDSGGAIHGCYKTSNGSLKVIDSDLGQTCMSGESALNWNQTGPQGPQGNTGATGVQGPAGADGQDGVSGYEIVVSSSVDLDPGAGGSAIATCPSGKKTVGGGFERIFGNGNLFIVSLSEPISAGDSWLVGVSNADGGSPAQFRAYAICVYV